MSEQQYVISEDMAIHRWTKAELEQYYQNVYEMYFEPENEQPDETTPNNTQATE